MAYYSLQFHHQIILSHPDWGWVNEKGEPQSERGRPARMLAALQRPITLADAVRVRLTSGS